MALVRVSRSWRSASKISRTAGAATLRPRAALADDDHDRVLGARRRPVAGEPGRGVVPEDLARARLARDGEARPAGSRRRPTRPSLLGASHRRGPCGRRPARSRPPGRCRPMSRDRRDARPSPSGNRQPPAAARACHRWRSPRRRTAICDRGHREITLADGEVDRIACPVLDDRVAQFSLARPGQVVGARLVGPRAAPGSPCWPARRSPAFVASQYCPLPGPVRDRAGGFAGKVDPGRPAQSEGPRHGDEGINLVRRARTDRPGRPTTS